MDYKAIYLNTTFHMLTSFNAYRANVNPYREQIYTSGVTMEPIYITLHETSNYSKGSNAKAHAKLQFHGNTRQASWHYTCGLDGIYQSIPTNEVGYHAGDGAGDGNTKSIGIEICVNKDGDFELAKKNAVWLIRHLMEKFNIPLEDVVPHQKWTGKYCPREILDEGWDKFIYTRVITSKKGLKGAWLSLYN